LVSVAAPAATNITSMTLGQLWNETKLAGENQTQHISY
jgi:hypothetical protein